MAAHKNAMFEAARQCIQIFPDELHAGLSSRR